MEGKIKQGDFIRFIQNSLEKLNLKLSAEDISRRSIGRPETLLRPLLIDAVKRFQNLCEKDSLLSSDKQKPLKWLPNNTTIGMIDAYFSIGCPEIEKVQASLRPKRLPDIDIDFNNDDIEQLKKVRPALLRRYAKICGLKNNSDLERRPVYTCLDKDIPEWQMPIFELEDKINSVICQGEFFMLSKNGKYVDWITEQTTVGELMDVFVQCLIDLKVKYLEKKK